MKTRTAHRDRRRLLRNSRRNDRNKALSPCLRRLGFEPLEDRCLLSGVAQESALELFSLSPALFVENQGQWADESVRFLHQGDGVNVAMTDAGPAFQVFQRDGSAALTPDLSPGCGRGEDVPADHASRVLQFSASFVGANLVVPVGLEQAETVFNYCIGPQEDWRSGVPSYEVVAYQNLYDGIDLQTWGQRDHLKYEFHVAPGADYRQIQVRYAGIAGLSLGEDGSLRLDLGDGWDALTDDAPYIYQQIDGQQTEIPGRFVLIDNETYAVEVTGAYDPTRELVLDPDLAWSTYLGGSGEDRGRGLAVDGAGNALVTGYTGSSGWTSGGFDTSFNGDTDAFVAKLSPSGEHVWSTYLGESDHGWGVAADAAGNALVTGITGPSDWTSGGFDTSFNGDCDAFVAKLSPSGGHLWSTYLGGDLPDWGFGIAADAAGNALMTGLTYSPGWTSGGFDTTYHGGDDAFVAKLSPSGGHLWSSYLGGDLLDWGNGIVADAAGNALVTGGTSSSGWTSGGFDTTFNGDFDAFVAKVSPSGGYLWSSYLGGNDTDEGCGIAVDAAGNVLVTGDTWSRGWTSGGFDTSYNGGADDAFAAKLSASGGQLWSTYLGGGDSDVAYGIGVDGAGNALVTGLTGSSGWTSGGFDTDFNGSADAFVAKLSPSGGHLWSTYLGGDSGDSGNGIAVDAAGNALVTGDTYSSDWVSGGFDTSYNGGEDAFVAKISGAGTPADANDTLAAATNLGTLDSGVSISQAGQIGDGASGSRDVDLLRFTLAQAGTLTLDVDAESAGSSLDAYLRLFDASGAQIAASDDVDGLDPYVSVSFPAGTYYVGVSGIPNRSYDPARLEGRVDSSTTGPYTLVITASGGEPGTWSPQIALGVPEGYDGNPDPGIFGRYLTGGVVPTVDVPFTVEVTPSPGYTTQAVALDLNFDGQRDPDEIVYAGDWTWTLDVSHSAYLQASGLHTLSVWAEGTTGGWSASATFQIETLALPGWMDPELTRIEFNPSAERYEIDSLIGERFGVNTPDWFPDWLEYRDGQKTFNGVYFGVSVEAYAKLSGKVVTESVAPVIGMSVLGIDFPLKLKANGVGFTCDLLRFWDLCKDPQGYFQGNNDPRASGFYDQRVAVPEVTFSVESQAALDDELQFTMFQVSANVQAQASGKFFELSLPEVPFPIPGAPGVSIVLTPHFGWSPYFDVDFTMNLDPSLRPHFQTSSVGLGVEGEAGVTGEVSIVGGIARGGADVTGSIAVGFQATYDGDWTRSIPVTLGMDIDFVGSVLWGLLKGRIPVWEWQWTGNLWTSGSGLGGGALDAEGSGQGASDDTLLVDASMAGSTTGEIAYAWTTINMDGTASPLSVQRYDGTSWQPAEQVIGSDYHRGNPAIISLGSDRWMAMWSQSNLAADRLAGLSGDQIVAEQEIWYAVREASGWGPPQRLTNNAVCDDSPALAALADGNVVAVWRRMAGTSTCDIAESDLVCAVWDGTAWSPPVTLADTDQRLSQPALATLLDNRVVATWLSDATASGQGVTLWSAVFEGTSWSAAQPVSDSTPKVRNWSRLVTLSDGSAVALWTEGDSAGAVLMSARRDPIAGQWGLPEQATDPQPIVGKPEALADARTVRVVYHGFGQENEIVGITRDYSVSGSAWTAPQLLTPETGDAWFAWAAADYVGDTQLRYIRDTGLQSAGIGTKPDLQIGPDAVSLGVIPPSAGVLNSVEATITNGGFASSGAASAALYQGDLSSGGTLLGTLPIPALGVGQSVTIQSPWMPQTTGACELCVVADSGASVSEMCEDNNQASFSAVLVAPPTLALDPASDTGTPGDGWTADTTPTVTGTAGEGTWVGIFVDAQAVPLVTATVTAGSYSATLPPLENGPRTLWAQGFDGSGNPSPFSAPLTIVLDATVLPTPTAPHLDPASDTGVVGDGITTIQRPQIVGTAKPLMSVLIYNGDALLGEAISDQSGSYVLAPAADLSLGRHAISVVQTDGLGNGSAHSSDLDLIIGPWVVDRHVFYNNSAFDGNDPLANQQDDLAIAADKVALLPGQEAGFENYTTYSRGINGVMVDIAGLADPVNLNSEDFEFTYGNDNDPDGWAAVTAVPTIDVRPGDGENGSDRVTIVFDDNAVPARNWLRVRVKATENTGLAYDDVFYFGNAIGDADGDGVAAYADMYAIYQQLGQPADMENPLDLNRDGTITEADIDAVFAEIGRMPVLQMIRAPHPADDFLTDVADQYAVSDNEVDLGVPIVPLYTDRNAGGTYGEIRTGSYSPAPDPSGSVTWEDTCTDAGRGVSSLEITWDRTGQNGWFEFNIGAEVANRPRDLAEFGNAEAVRFMAKGDTPQTGVDDQQVRVKVLRTDPTDGWAELTSEVITLDTAWADFAVDLSGFGLTPADLHSVQFVLGDELSPGGGTIWLDEVRINAEGYDPLRVLQSYEPRCPIADPPFTPDMPEWRDENVYPHLSSLYDNALAIKTLLAIDDPHARDTAIEAADAMIATALPDGSYYQFRNAGHVLDSDGTPRPPLDLSRSLGDNAWLGLALLDVYRSTGNAAYLGRARAISDWAETHLRYTGTWGGYQGGCSSDGAPQLCRSTEHNIDLFALNRQLATELRNLGDPDAATYAARATYAGDFVMAMFDPAEGKFWTGTGDGTGIGLDEINTTFVPLDTQMWSVLSLGLSPEYAAAIDWQRPLQWAEANLRVTAGPYSGFTFDTGATPNRVWFEGTAYAAAAYHVLGEAAKYVDTVHTLELARQTHPNGDGKGLVAASDDGLQTGFGGWYDARLHLGATAWSLMAQLGINPLGSADGD